MAKKLIVNGDDFGLSPEVNAGIIRCHREGVLTSASVMIGERWRDEAVSAARELPNLDAGLHVVVCMGACVLPATRDAGLTDPAGYFPRNPVSTGMRYFFDRKLRGLLRDEIRAQIELHLKLIGHLHHVDGHVNFHVHPAIVDILLELAAEYGIACVRMPREPLMTTLRLSPQSGARKIVESIIFRTLSARLRKKASALGIYANQWLFGLHQYDNMSERYLLGVIDRLPDGVTEFYFHPAADLGRQPPAAQRQLEVHLLTSPKIRTALRARGIELTNFAALAASRPRAAQTGTSKSA